LAFTVLLLYHIDMDFRRKSALCFTAQHNAAHCASYDHNIKQFRRKAKLPILHTAELAQKASLFACL